ncbi:MAG: hypothetical protein RSE41_00805 [Clostridia bacterium]
MLIGFLSDVIYDGLDSIVNRNSKMSLYIKDKKTNQKLKRKNITKKYLNRKKQNKKIDTYNCLTMDESIFFKYICYFNDINIDDLTDEKANIFKEQIYNLREDGKFDNLEYLNSKEKANLFFKEIIKIK